MSPDRLLAFSGGLCGAAGVVLSALAAHAGGGNVATAASFLLMHAPLFVALGLFGTRGVPGWAAWGLLLGLLLFAGDLLMRHYLGSSLFPMAAPAGGALMILGWLGVAATALRGP